ncbi:MAG TPA: zinc ribbon domain-containing protein [Micromonosporaceae bacterium]|nr:zinc ribbon domain-containing protein [Micromonosporaceae bacterium]
MTDYLAVAVRGRHPGPDRRGALGEPLVERVAVFIMTCTVCGGPMRANRRKTEDPAIYVCAGNDEKADLGRGHSSIGVSYADGQIVARLVRQMEDTGRVSFRPLPPDIDVAPLLERKAGIMQRMEEIAQDRAANVMPRPAYLAAANTLNAELAEVQAELASAGSWGPVKQVDVEAAYEEFEELDLGEQRTIIREAFEYIRLVPRGKGRPKAGEGIWKSELIKTEFTEAWS